MDSRPLFWTTPRFDEEDQWLASQRTWDADNIFDASRRRAKLRMLRSLLGLYAPKRTMIRIDERRHSEVAIDSIAGVVGTVQRRGIPPLAKNLARAWRGVWWQSEAQAFGTPFALVWTDGFLLLDGDAWEMLRLEAARMRGETTIVATIHASDSQAIERYEECEDPGCSDRAAG